MILHNHLLVNGNTYQEINNCHTLNQWLKHLVKAIDMKVVIEPRSFYIDKDGNKGITGQIGIETSHIAIHVWDEPVPSRVQFDLYTCGVLPVSKVLYMLEKDLKLIDYNYLVLERGDEFNIVDSGVSSGF